MISRGNGVRLVKPVLTVDSKVLPNWPSKKWANARYVRPAGRASHREFPVYPVCREFLAVLER